MDRRSFMGGLITVGAAGLGGAGLFSTDALAAQRTPAARLATTWRSGAGGGNANINPDRSAQGSPFGSWRGERVTYTRIWADVSLAEMRNMGMLKNLKARGYAESCDIGCGGPQGGQTWASAAAGGMDATWRAQCATIRANWGQLKEVHLSMAHEMNGNWYAWSVNRGQESSFIAAWRRWHGIVQVELVGRGFNVKTTINYNAESTGPQHTTFWPGDAYVDIIGVDCYAWWGHYASLPGWVSFAKAHGKQLSFPEWGLNPATNTDDPAFIRNMNNLFRQNAAILAGESYFNEMQASLDSTVPNATAAYRAAAWGV